jgi:DNA-directed RNA polymerase subunit RPC12/RpoP
MTDCNCKEPRLEQISKDWYRCTKCGNTLHSSYVGKEVKISPMLRCPICKRVKYFRIDKVSGTVTCMCGWKTDLYELMKHSEKKELFDMSTIPKGAKISIHHPTNLPDIEPKELDPNTTQRR